LDKSKFIGAILLIVGTSIGGGMLALPVSTAALGIGNSIFFLVACWLVMTSGALLILEVNLRLPAGSNMISMARSTLGLPGEILTWISYLFLLYTLLAAYISGGSDVFNSILVQMGVSLPNWLTALLFTFLFSLVIYGGIKTVDYINRGLMFGKLGIYCLLILIISPHVDTEIWKGGSLSEISGCLLILITSFGFASIVPSLRTYFHDDVKTLRKVIILGSLIPLICYICWDAVIMGVIHKEGDAGLLHLLHSEHATSELTLALNQKIESKFITGFFAFFTSICMVTAFLGVSLGLFDFIADGLKLNKKGHQGRGILALTFLPPLLVVLLFPGIYLKALSYAGVCCIILLLLLPSLMAWKGRKLSTSSYEVIGGNFSILVISTIAIFLLGFALVIK
jgi:tyrosine-specific transport protein